VLKLATERMWNRPSQLADRAISSLKGIKPKPKILVVGIGFKKGQSLTTNSPGLAIANILKQSGAEVWYADPLVSPEQLPQAQQLDHHLNWNHDYINQNFDKVIVTMLQSGLDLGVLKQIEVQMDNYTGEIFL
jgi:UDP-N-acetyl-D-mannosaminuronate dehydrogenase